MNISKSAHFQFDDDKATVAFVWGRGKSINREMLHYSKSFYPTVKEAFKGFLEETDLRLKISSLANILNLGSEDERIKKICFLLEIMWRYDFSKKEAVSQ